MENTAAPVGADRSKFKLKELCTSGGFSYAKVGQKEQVSKTIEDGKAMFKANPSKYIAMAFQANMVSWPPDKQKFTLYHREGTEKFAPRIDPNGWMSVLLLEDDIPKSADSTAKTTKTSPAVAVKKPNDKQAPTKKPTTITKPKSVVGARPRSAPAPVGAATVEDPYRGVDSSKFKLKEHRTSGGVSYAKVGQKEQVTKPIEDGKAMFKANPSKYIAMTYQSNMVSWPPEKQKFTLYHREGTEKFAPAGINPNGRMSVLLLEDDIPKCADSTAKTVTTSPAVAAKKPNAKQAPTKKPTTTTKPKSVVGARPRSAPAPVGAATVEDPYRGVDSSKFKLKEHRTSGGVSYAKVGQKEQVTKPIEDGKAMFKANPSKYIAMTYQSNMVSWPPEKQKFTLYHRDGTEKFAPAGIDPNGRMSFLLLAYEHLPPFKDHILPAKNHDKYTDVMVHKNRKIHDNKNYKPLMPGRGMGCCDTPLCKIIGDVDPSDIHQGQVGDCWLLSAISALAEFDGAVKKLFRKTKNLEKMPLPGPNQYIITLTDLTTWKEVDIIIDERLAVAPDGRLLASKPSEDGELWVCYLEKAISIHCGGWDNITGGQSTHAWAIMTGCKEQYTIKKRSNGKYTCHARFHPKTNEWAPHHNSPKEGNVGVYQVAWPEVGGGGNAEKECTQDELFMKMYAFDQENYIVSAGTTAGGNNKKKTDEGLVDNHAYTVIEAVHNAAGTGIDLFKVRNPWGTGEIEDGDFDDDGPGWDKYPQIKNLLKPVVADDGIFW